MALNISGLHKVLNEIFHGRYLTVLWICLEFWICQGFKYVSSSEYVTVTQGFVEKGLQYFLGSQYTRAWIYGGCEYVKVTNCVLKIHGILNVLSSEYAKVLNVS